MSKIYILLFIMFFVINSFSTGFSQNKKVDFSVTLDNSPVISRFPGFTALISEDVLKTLDRNTLKLYINGEDFSEQLNFNLDAKTGSLYISFEPAYPLPIGQVVQKLTGLTNRGDYFEKSWSFLVDPLKDKELAKFYKILQKEPGSVSAHLGLAGVYENKYLLKDAQNEYLTVLQLDPANEKARKSYERIFALWDHKMIRYGDLKIEVFMDQGLLNLGKLIIFNLKISNKGNKPISIDPTKNVLVDETGKQFEPVSNLATYPKKALDRKWVNLDEYARLSYYLQTNSFPLLNAQDIAPSATVQGFVIFSFPGGKVSKVLLSIPEQNVGEQKETFLFPFVL
ncbi:MAG: hypothetical protein ABRQ39_17395 [Candidatus Eremiobacterota bacterium]